MQSQARGQGNPCRSVEQISRSSSRTTHWGSPRSGKGNSTQQVSSCATAPPSRWWSATAARSTDAGSRSRADPVEQHLRRTEPAGEDFPLSVRICSGAPRRAASPAAPHTPGRRSPPHQLGRHCEPGAVIDPAHRLQLHPVGQVVAPPTSPAPSAVDNDHERTHQPGIATAAARRKCQAPTGKTVAQVPEPRLKTVNQLPVPAGQA